MAIGGLSRLTREVSRTEANSANVAAGQVASLQNRLAQLREEEKRLRAMPTARDQHSAKVSEIRSLESQIASAQSRAGRERQRAAQAQEAEAQEDERQQGEDAARRRAFEEAFSRRIDPETERLLRQAARGEAPSAAQEQLRQSFDQARQAQLSAQAGLDPRAGAAAQAATAQRLAGLQQQAASQGASLRAQEMAAARAALAGFATNQRGSQLQELLGRIGDITNTRGQDFGRIANNQQFQLGQGRLELGQDQLELQRRQFEEQRRQANRQFMMQLLGAGAGAAGAAFGSPAFLSLFSGGGGGAGAGPVPGINTVDPTTAGAAGFDSLGQRVN